MKRWSKGPFDWRGKHNGGGHRRQHHPPLGQARKDAQPEQIAQAQAKAKARGTMSRTGSERSEEEES